METNFTISVRPSNLFQRLLIKLRLLPSKRDIILVKGFSMHWFPIAGKLLLSINQDIDKVPETVAANNFLKSSQNKEMVAEIIAISTGNRPLKKIDSLKKLIYKHMPEEMMVLAIAPICEKFKVALEDYRHIYELLKDRRQSVFN